MEAGRLVIASFLIVVVISNAWSQDRVGAQETEDVPAVISELVELLPQDDGDPLLAEFLLAPSETGSLGDDPVGDVAGFGEVEPGSGGPDLIRFSMFTLPAQHLIDGFATLIESEPRPTGITLYGQDPWVAPGPETTVVAVVAEFDRTLTVNLEDACITQLNVRRPGPTTPEARLFTEDPRRDTNISYQLAGWETLPTYATEADTTTEAFDTVVRDSSLFGAVFDSQAVLFVPLSQLEDVSAVRVGIRCTSAAPAGGSSDQSDLVPFDPTSLAAAYFGPASAIPEPSTTTTTTSPATTGDSAAVEGDDPTGAAGEEAEEALEATPGLTAADPSSPRDLLGTWALIVGLTMVAAGGWVLHATPLWGRPDGPSAEAGPD